MLRFRHSERLALQGISDVVRGGVILYTDSMQPLVYKDIQNSLAEIEKL